MKRLLCAAVIAAAAATAAPANAETAWPVQPHVWNRPDRVGVGASYDVRGQNYQPLGAAWVNPQTGEVCVGFSYQIPQCVGGGPVS